VWHMSLVVSAYSKRATGSTNTLEPDDPTECLAGFESYRTKLYGSQASKVLGLSLLTRLGSGDLYAEGADLQRLKAEVDLALANLDMFEAEAGAPSKELRRRFENILKAISRASQVENGGVVIW
jgi:hypothetical protein